LRFYRRTRSFVQKKIPVIFPIFKEKYLFNGFDIIRIFADSIKPVYEKLLSI